MPKDIKNDENQLIEQKSPQEAARYSAMTQWLNGILTPPLQIEALAPDASFRCYYRIHHQKKRYIVMDAPAQIKSSEPFVRLTDILKERQVNVPVIYAQDLTQGFLLLSDLGSTPLFHAITPDNATTYYCQAFDQLINIQHIPQQALSSFDQHQARIEINWLNEWYLDRYLNFQPSPTQTQLINQAFDYILSQSFKQPFACIHYDFQSFNLMVMPDNEIGVIDYQDAQWGPIAFDLASLVYDHYISWTTEQQDEWINAYRMRLIHAQLIDEHIDFDTFRNWVDLLALFRLLRNFGNFARLYLYHNKRKYIDHLPRMFEYVIDICSRHEQLHAFAQLFTLCNPNNLESQIQ